MLITFNSLNTFYICVWSCICVCVCMCMYMCVYTRICVCDYILIFFNRIIIEKNIIRIIH